MILVLWLSSFACVGIGHAQQEPMRLRLKDGSFAMGELKPSVEAGRLGWKSNGFQDPFQFDLRSLRSVTAILAPETEKDLLPTTGQLFELSNGQIVAGQLVEINDKHLIADSRVLGRVRIDRTQVVSIVDAGYVGQVVYSGPIDDERWKPLTKDDDWLFEGGALVASRQGAAIVGDVSLPSKSQINIILSWKGVADFVVSFGTLANNKISRIEEIPAAARLEVWDKQLALVREVDGGADIALISDLTGANPRIELTIYLDQEAGVVTVCDSHGRPLDTVKAVANRKTIRDAVHLVNLGPSLMLERFEVREWDGRTTSAVTEGDRHVVDSQGTPIKAAITGYDAETKELILTDAEGNAVKQLPIGSLRRGDFRPSTAVTQEVEQEDAGSPPAVVQPDPPGADPSTDEAQTKGEDKEADDEQDEDPRSDDGWSEETLVKVLGLADAENERAEPVAVEFIFTDRTRLTGTLLPADGKFRLQTSFVYSESDGDSLAFRPQDVRGIIGTNERFVNNLTEHKNGTLKLGETQLAGYLDETSPTDSVTALHWHPHSSLNSSQILADFDGAIIYRKSLPRIAQVMRGSEPLQQRKVTPVVEMFLGGANPSKDQSESSPDPQAREISFRTGDAIDGIVTQIDERGMTFVSDQTSTTFAEHARIQSIWLQDMVNSMDPSKEKLARLMTVPRSMKKDPPTHLFVSITGDYLRGRLVRLEKDFLTIEVRLELVDIPTSQVAQIIWLHDREWEESEKAAVEPDVPQGVEMPFRVHTISAGDRGLTFQPEAMRDGILGGKSELLGDCSIPVASLNQLLFGRDIGKHIREFREDPWTLSLAQYPRVYMDDGSGEGSAAVANPLVGLGAPDFGLKTLEGQSFRLSRQQGKIVVLDFWASWCGPCMQTMPQVDEAVAEIGTDKIELVAVNIQESALRVQSAVERLNLSATVLMDVDGEVASAYQANAIPQTVIIDRDGNVTHVFVGGGPRFLAQFKEALSAAVAE